MLLLQLLVVAAAVAVPPWCIWCLWSFLAGFFAKSAALAPIPSPPPSSWLLGHPGVLESDRAPYLLHNYAKELGRIFRLRLAHLQVVVCVDPAEAMRVCSRGDDYIDKSPAIYKAFNWVHANPELCNILTLQTDDQWRAIRRAVAACFTSANLRSAFPILVEAAEEVARQLEAAGPTKPYNFNNISQRFTIDAIAAWGFDTPMHASWTLDTEHKFVTMVDKMIHAVHTVLSDPLWKVKRHTKEVQAGIKAAKEYDIWMAGFTQRLQDRAAELSPTCIGAALLAVRDPAFVEGKLSFDELKTNAAILFAAGYETTANTITIMLILLANHPEWQERIEAELDSAQLLRTASRRQPRALAYADLSQLPVMNAVIKETLRLLPAAGLGTFRETKRETEICGYKVPAGVVVNFPPYAIENGVLAYGADAEQFRPDRWLTKGASNWSHGATADDAPPVPGYQVHANGTWSAGSAQAAADANGRIKEPIAFSMGPRDCVGQTLARMELQVFLTLLLSRFRLHLATTMGSPADARASIIYHLTFTTKQGLWMTAEPR